MRSRLATTAASSRIGWARIWPDITSGARHPPARLENSVVIADILFVAFCRGQASCSLAPIATPPSYGRGMRMQCPGHSAPVIWFDKLLLRQSRPIATLRAGPRSLRAELSEDGRVMDGTTGGALPAIHPSAAGQRRAVPFSRLCVMPRCVTLPLLVLTARWSSTASKHAWISGAALTSLPASIAATTGATRWRHWPSSYRAGWRAWFPAARRSARRGPTMGPIVLRPCHANKASNSAGHSRRHSNAGS